MNKFIKCLPLCALMLVVVSVLSGCIFTLSAPTLTLQGYTLSWESQKNAQKYEVVFNDTSIIVNENKLDISQYLNDSSTQTVKVKAFSKSIFYNDSDYSEVLTISLPTTKLSTPENVAVNIQNNQYIASWDAITNATSYSLKLVNQTNNNTTFVSSTTTSCDLTKYLTASGSFVVYVRALASNLNTYAPSEWAQSAEFEWVTYLETPKTTLSGNTLRWNAVDGAKQYVVANQRGDTVTVSSNSCNLSTSGLLGTGENNMTALFVQAVANTNAGYDSPYSDGVTYYASKTTSALKSTKLSYLGSDFDLYANDEAELHNIVFYTLYYRITDIKFAIGYASSGYDTLVRNQLQQYDEIMSISYFVSSLSGVLTLKIDFGHPNTPTLTADGDYTVVQSDAIQPTSYTNSPRTSTFDNFAIDSRTQSIVVFNSDQLYVALQNGFKPVFTSTNSPALTVYNLAKNVLRQIVDDTMTDLQKVTAIYDWLCYTVKYDYDLLDITEEKESIGGDGVQAELAKYKGFYIEGVLLDNGQAVCDGISKTFVLLCNLENIDAYKVSGVANGGNHAWNKVSLDLNDDSQNEWYTVDATWGDSTEKTSTYNYVEYLSHSYFLVTDSMIGYNSHTETSPKKDTSSTSFNYYADTKITDGTNTASLYVTTDEELSTLLTIVDNLGLEGIEFSASSSISWSFSTKLKYDIKTDSVNISTYGKQYIYILLPK